MQEKLDVAETFLERVISQDSENVIAWTLYTMLYEQKGEEMNAYITLKKVIKLNQTQVLHEQQLAEAAEAAEDVSQSKKEDDIDEIKTEMASKSRNSKRGTLTQQPTKVKLLDGSNKSKSPGNNLKKFQFF